MAVSVVLIGTKNMSVLQISPKNLQSHCHHQLIVCLA